MMIRRAGDIRPSEITPFGVYLNRRQLIGAGTALSLGSLLARTVRADALAAPKSQLSTDQPCLLPRANRTCCNVRHTS